MIPCMTNDSYGGKGIDLFLVIPSCLQLHVTENLGSILEGEVGASYIVNRRTLHIYHSLARRD